MFLGLFEPSETDLDLLTCWVPVTLSLMWAPISAGLARSLQRLCIPSGHVIACEPYPANAAAPENLTLNGATNVQVAEMALGSESGVLCLAMAGDSGDVTALDWARKGRVEVAMTTLDEIAADTASVHSLKMDVEGWEAHVLKGGSKTLARTGNVMIEINRPALKEASASPDEIFDLLRQAGFNNFRVLPQTGLRRLSRSDGVTNILATR